LVVAEGTGPEGETVPAGFVAGSTDVGRLYREFLRHDGPAAVVRCAPRLARAAPRAWETLRYGTRPAGGGPGGGPAAPHAGAGEAELLAMAVDPGFRRRGVGAALVQAFFQRAASAGSPSARVVVGASNAAAVTLYRHGGFTDQHELEVHRGVRSLVLRTAPGRPTP
jgi:ribosomal-protein-alanine N-acetyltransferase